MRFYVMNRLTYALSGCAVLTAALAVADEPAHPAQRIEARIGVHAPVPGHFMIVRKLLEHIGQPQEAACQSPECQAEKTGRSGLHVQVIPGTVHGQVLVLPDLAAACKSAEWPVQACPPTAACTAGVCKSCPAECTASGCTASGCTAKCGTAPATHVTTKAGCACDDCECHKCQCGDCPCRPAAHTASSQCQRDKFWEHLVEISSEKAALEAALEAHTSFAEERNEMFGTFAELMKENAKLAAKIEHQGERDELVKQILELSAQNAQLKATAELADARVKLMQQSIELAAQNERLQHRVAELERQASEHSEGTKRVR